MVSTLTVHKRKFTDCNIPVDSKQKILTNVVLVIGIVTKLVNTDQLTETISSMAASTFDMAS